MVSDCRRSSDVAFPLPESSAPCNFTLIRKHFCNDIIFPDILMSADRIPYPVLLHDAYCAHTWGLFLSLLLAPHCSVLQSLRMLGLTEVTALAEADLQPCPGRGHCCRQI